MRKLRFIWFYAEACDEDRQRKRSEREKSQGDDNNEGNEKTSLVKQTSMIEVASTKAKTTENMKAASMAENIHANNHRGVLQGSDQADPIVNPVFTVISTKENLEERRHRIGESAGAD